MSNESKCVWIEDSEDSHAYDTECGSGFYFAETSAVEAGINYCHNCGGPVEIWKAVWDDERMFTTSELERKAPSTGEQK